MTKGYHGWIKCIGGQEEEWHFWHGSISLLVQQSSAERNLSKNWFILLGIELFFEPDSASDHKDDYIGYGASIAFLLIIFGVLEWFYGPSYEMKNEMSDSLPLGVRLLNDEVVKSNDRISAVFNAEWGPGEGPKNGKRIQRCKFNGEVVLGEQVSIQEIKGSRLGWTRQICHLHWEKEVTTMNFSVIVTRWLFLWEFNRNSMCQTNLSIKNFHISIYSPFCSLTLCSIVTHTETHREREK